MAGIQSYSNDFLDCLREAGDDCDRDSDDNDRDAAILRASACAGAAACAGSAADSEPEDDFEFENDITDQSTFAALCDDLNSSLQCESRHEGFKLPTPNPRAQAAAAAGRVPEALPVAGSDMFEK